MPTRVGIEVSAGRCRLVEADVRTVITAQAAIAPVRVRRFHSFEWDPRDPATLTAGLKSARSLHGLPRQAWVTLWGVASAFRFLQLPPADPAHIEAIARREAGDELSRFGPLPGDAASAAILGDTVESEGPPRREVALVAASAADIRARLEPIVAAGFTVGGVLVPSMALVSLARLVPAGLPGKAVAYLALGADASSLAIVRNGLPLFARELPWGYHGNARLPDRDTLATRLASELRRSFLFFKQTFRTSVDLVVTCGDYRDLRSLTAPLIASLDIEIETLDSPAGIDLNALPAPEDRFRDDLAALRLAWASAVDASPPVNLLPQEILSARARQRQIVVLGAGAAAGIALAAALYFPADRQADLEEARVLELRQTVARMEPIARQRDATRQTSITGAAQKAALDALGEHGPRLGRALEHLAAGAPEGLRLTTVAIRSEGAEWRATIAGVAIADDPATGQRLVSLFLRTVAASPYFGEVSATPRLRVLTGARAGEQGSEQQARATIPEGKSGVEFTVEFPLPR
ncbi:MAG: hypothetical protein WD690_05175 [Vicinamibacterales bacterium]